MAHDVFITYSSHDKRYADAICEGLETAGVGCWIAPRDIIPSSVWAEAIIDAISASKLLVVVFSGHANASPQVIREVERAVNRQIPVIPVRIEDVAPSKAMEYFLSSPHWLDAMTEPLDQHVSHVVKTVRTVLQRGIDPAASMPAPSLATPVELSGRVAAPDRPAGWNAAKLVMPLVLLAIALAVAAIINFRSAPVSAVGINDSVGGSVKDSVNAVDPAESANVVVAAGPVKGKGSVQAYQPPHTTAVTDSVATAVRLVRDQIARAQSLSAEGRYAAASRILGAMIGKSRDLVSENPTSARLDSVVSELIAARAENATACANHSAILRRRGRAAPPCR